MLFFGTTNCPAGKPAGQFFVYIRMASAYSRSVIGGIKFSMALLLIACGSKPAADTDGGAASNEPKQTKTNQAKAAMSPSMCPAGTKRINISLPWTLRAASPFRAAQRAQARCPSSPAIPIPATTISPATTPTPAATPIPRRLAITAASSFDSLCRLLAACWPACPWCSERKASAADPQL